MTLSNLSSIFFYLLIFILTSLFSLLYSKTEKKFLAILAILIPSVAVASRFGVGTDSLAYTEMFDNIAKEPFKISLFRITTFSMEPTAVLLIKLLSHFSFGYFAFFLAYSLLTFTCLFLFSKKASPKNIWFIFSILALIMLPYCINGMRQAAAISLFSLLLVRILKHPRAILQNASLFLLTICLHFSAIILLPVLFIAPALKRFSAKKVAFFATCALLAALFIFPKFIAFMLASGLMPGKYADTLEFYSGSIINFDFAIFFALAALLTLTRKHSNSESSNHNSYSALILLCGLFYASLGFYSAYIGRMADYFWPFVVFGFWLGIDRFKDKRAFKCTVFIAILVLYFILSYFVLGNSQIIPFRFIS